MAQYSICSFHKAAGTHSDRLNLVCQCRKGSKVAASRPWQATGRPRMLRQSASEPVPSCANGEEVRQTHMKSSEARRSWARSSVRCVCRQRPLFHPFSRVYPWTESPAHLEHKSSSEGVSFLSENAFSGKERQSGCQCQKSFFLWLSMPRRYSTICIRPQSASGSPLISQSGACPPGSKPTRLLQHSTEPGSRRCRASGRDPLQTFIDQRPILCLAQTRGRDG